MLHRAACLLPALALACAGVRARPAPAPAVAAAPQAPAAPSLYQRLGGIEALRAVVPRFLGNVAADERIGYLFALSDLEALRGKLVDYFCHATGGPCQYTGRDMRSAHAQLPLESRHFDALVEDLARTLDDMHVPVREKGELLAALAPLRGDVVGSR